MRLSPSLSMYVSEWVREILSTRLRTSKYTLSIDDTFDPNHTAEIRAVRTSTRMATKQTQTLLRQVVLWSTLPGKHRRCATNRSWGPEATLRHDGLACSPGSRGTPLPFSSLAAGTGRRGLSGVLLPPRPEKFLFTPRRTREGRRVDCPPVLRVSVWTIVRGP